jgi:hypothetical protein
MSLMLLLMLCWLCVQHWQTQTTPTKGNQKAGGRTAAAQRPAVQLTIDSAEQLQQRRR